MHLNQVCSPISYLKFVVHYIHQSKRIYLPTCDIPTESDILTTKYYAISYSLAHVLRWGNAAGENCQLSLCTQFFSQQLLNWRKIRVKQFFDVWFFIDVYNCLTFILIFVGWKFVKSVWSNDPQPHGSKLILFHEQCTFQRIFGLFLFTSSTYRVILEFLYNFPYFTMFAEKNMIYLTYVISSKKCHLYNFGGSCDAFFILNLAVESKFYFKKNSLLSRAWENLVFRVDCLRSLMEYMFIG